MALRVQRQQENALIVAQWLQSEACPRVTSVLYAGLPSHLDYDLHMSQASGIFDVSIVSIMLSFIFNSGGGAVVCFQTGNFEFSKHIVTTTKLFKITVSFGGVSSLISVPGQMSHASIPEEVRSERAFPEDLVRMSIGIENAQDLINDLKSSMDSYSG